MSQREASGDVGRATVTDALKSQYHAGLAMLREAVESCPDDLWLDETPTNAYWQVAYHTVYFTHLYLQVNEAAFVPWRDHQGGVQHPDGIVGPPRPGDTSPLGPDPYSKDQVLDYLAELDAAVDGAVDVLDLNSPDSGFRWYPISKLEHQLVNVRHLQHHSAQLADRLRSAVDVGVRWIGARH